MVEFVNHVSNKEIDVSGLPQDLIASVSPCASRRCILCVRNRQTGYHLLPPQEIVYPDLQSACVELFNDAENVYVGCGSDAVAD